MNEHGSELQVLLVEDNASDAELTMDALRDSGMVNRVQWVKDGAEALDVLFGQGTASARPGPPLGIHRRFRAFDALLRLCRHGILPSGQSARALARPN